jgi:predicted MFS family arabinose efflux permease
MLIGGLLGDYFGRRRVLLLASILTAAGGLLTMVAPDATWLVVARSMGSAAGAIALPLTLAVIRLRFVGRDRVRALLVYNLVICLGLLLSLLAVAIEAAAGWRATLVLPTLAIAIGSVLVWRFIPESRAVAGALDQATTAVAWSLTLLPLTLGAVFARVNGSWANPITGVALALSVIGLVALVFVWRGRVRTSMLRGLGQRQRYLLTVMLLTAASLAFGVTGYLVQLYGFFTVVQNYGLVLGGVALLPMLLGFVLTAGWATRTVAHLEARRLIGGGLAVMALSMAATSLVRSDTPYWWFVPPLVLFGCGYLAAQTAWTTAFMSAMPDAVVGASAGVTKATIATGAALAGVVLSTVVVIAGQADLIQKLTAQHLSPGQIASAMVALNAALSADAAANITVPTELDPALLAAYFESYTVGFGAAMLAAAALCLGAAALAWFVLPDSRSSAA